MNKSSTARGNTTRQANKELRKERILDVARDLITSNGFEAFTLSELAKKADVSIPTIHNLFGKKYDIFVILCEEMVVKIEEVMSNRRVQDPIEGAVNFIDSLHQLFRNNEAFYRAAFVTGERTQLFEHESPTGIFQKSLKIAQQTCEAAKENGFLTGEIDSLSLAQQLFGCQRLARQDWVNGYINLQQYRTQVLIGMYMIYAADGTPEFQQRLKVRIQELCDTKQY